MAAVFYPHSLRPTGVGWALGVGRLGGIAGPLVAGALYAEHWTPGEIFAFTTGPVMVAALSVAAMGHYYRNRGPLLEDSAARVPLASGLQ